ncbi:probable RNA-binding protein 46 [Uloborus diversus]|uniref:probable RNA-binding protein 46 n=1 Tax=Uloborus diversus TaxID=327109 RepID=UPI00240A91E7|nr:probable RNA-binding protein 46 [Uloborus diversus]
MDSYDLECKLLNLMQETGYNIVQENGQRIMGPPPGWVGPPPPKGCEVFVGNLPRDTFEDKLFPLFATVGTIYQFRLMMDFSKSNRGFAFVTYTNKVDCQKAIDFLNTYPIKRHRIGVMKSLDNCRLHITGIPREKGEAEVFSEIVKYTPNVANVTVHNNWNTKLHKGYAIIEYESHRAASMARRILIPGNVKLFDQKIKVEWALPETETIDFCDNLAVWYMASSSALDLALMYALLVRNIPAAVDEVYLYQLFSVRNKLKILKFKRIKDYAIVQYYCHADTLLALNYLNGILVKGCVLDVSTLKPQVAFKYLSKVEKIENYYQRHLKTCNENFMSDFQKLGLQGSFLPMQQLAYICRENKWGEPDYQIQQHAFGANASIFSCKLFIPHLPHPVKFVASSGIVHSAFEAKKQAAEYALRTICSSKYMNPLSNVVPQNEVVPFDARNENYNSTSYPAPVLPFFPPVSGAYQNDALFHADSSIESDASLELLECAASLASMELQAKAKINITRTDP